MITFDKEVKTINTKNIITLYVGEGNTLGYQRPVNPARVKKIVKEFNPNLVNPVKVSYRNGKYYCFDGNHTMSALILRNGGKNCDVQCMVFYGMSYEDEAKMFAEQNGLSAKVAKHARMKGLFEAGDAEIVKFVDELKEIGVVCDFKLGNSAPHRLLCYDTAYKLYKSNHDSFIKAAQIINTAWGTGVSLRGEFVVSVNQLCKVYGKQFEKTEAVKRFSKLSAEKIFTEAKDAKIITPAKAITQILLREYNRRRLKDGNNYLDPSLLYQEK